MCQAGRMGPFVWIIFGFVVGLVSQWLVKGNRKLGCLGTIGLGVIGSLVGGTIWNVLTGSGLDVAPGGLFLSVVGAVIVLTAAKKLAD